MEVVMDYQKSIQSLLKEAKKGNSYAQLDKPYRIFLKIALFPFYIVEFALIMAYYIELFFYNAMLSPVTYLEAWQDNKKEGIQHATQAVLFFISTPFIFFLRVLLSLMSFSFFFLWFELMCFTYLVTLGGIKWQPCINVIPEREGGETKLKATAGEKFATVALVFFGLFVILLPFVDAAYEAFMIAMFAYLALILIVNPIVCASARMPVAPVVEATKDAPPPILELEEANRSGMFDNFVFASLMTAFVAISMFLLAWSYNGAELFLDDSWYYYNPNGLPFVSVVLLILCAGMGVAKLALSMFMGIGKPVEKNAKTVLAGILVGICALGAAFGTLQYVRYLVDSNSYAEADAGYVSQSEAISIAKNSTTVKDAIASELNIDSYYSVDYSDSDANQIGSDSWEVTLTGTMYGNDYYGYSESAYFRAYVTVNQWRSVTSTIVYTY